MKTANEAWRELATLLLEKKNEQSVSPRGEVTIERLFAETAFDMNSPICYHQDRKLNYSFSAAEAYAITHGVPDTNFLVQYNKNMDKFSDDGIIFNGAYGPPFHNQLMYVVNTLLKDQQSRQAVLTIWRQNPVRSVDIACTLALQFLIRNGKLHCKVTMRSSDIWLGIPYDFFNFTMMALRVLTIYNLGPSPLIKLGTMHWSAGSSHLYVRNLKALEKVLASESDKSTTKVPERAYNDWRYVTDSLQACMDKDNERIHEQNLWRIRP
jgi:thymidylate synthase